MKVSHTPWLWANSQPAQLSSPHRALSPRYLLSPYRDERQAFGGAEGRFRVCPAPARLGDTLRTVVEVVRGRHSCDFTMSALNLEAATMFSGKPSLGTISLQKPGTEPTGFSFSDLPDPRESGRLTLLLLYHRSHFSLFSENGGGKTKYL